jgi:hypothetical protein
MELVINDVKDVAQKPLKVRGVLRKGGGHLEDVMFL